MGYFVCLFPMTSGVCRYFFQNVKKTDGGVKPYPSISPTIAGKTAKIQ